MLMNSMSSSAVKWSQASGVSAESRAYAEQQNMLPPFEPQQQQPTWLHWLAFLASAVSLHIRQRQVLLGPCYFCWS